MRLCWLTDIHLNFLKPEACLTFAKDVAHVHADWVIISGDIAEAPTLGPSLQLLDRNCSAQIAYVLGNHDYYRSSIDAVRGICGDFPGTYLHAQGPIWLRPDVALVGVDGWGDGVLGDARGSDLIFTDWHLIEDFRARDAIRDVDARLELLRARGAESATRLTALLSQVSHARRVLVATHVPPFDTAAGYDGSRYGDLWVPYLACAATGEVLTAFADTHPHVEIEVYCGHTHVARTVHPRRNITCHTGAATYRSPEIQKVWEVT